MSLELKPNFDVKALSQKAEMFPKSGTAALNRVARECISNISKDVSSRYNIKRSEVADKLSIVQANKSNMMVRIKAKSRGLTVMRFDARETHMGGGTVVTIMRGNSKVIRNAFINKVPKGGYKGKLVLARTTDARYPLEAIRTISITEMIGSWTISQRLMALIGQRLPEELMRMIKVWDK